ncbi:50S ribosome-binding GTPase [Candidatus Woesearchaeota archaeon]|nr:50S ribosome-binding GTPase [Candidatus Woesearchaeota archaeon]
MIVQRDNIGIFGKVNSGKSSLMNLLTQQDCSIVDSMPGTTADTKITLCEIHGMGPVKLFDTAGMDEKGGLGEKKRKKAFNDLKECDLILLAIDPGSKDFRTENEIIAKAREYDKQLLIIYNLFQNNPNIESVESGLNYCQFYKKIELKAVNTNDRQRLLNFMLSNFESKNKKTALLPFIKSDEYYLLNIPMDEETPPGRYLRPQAMCEEYITRNFAFPISYRMDLKKARGKDYEDEKKRYLDVLNGLKNKEIKCIITDSQAIDIISRWTSSGYDITTFSIMMINYMSSGRLKLFVDGIKALDGLKQGDKILIAEACNHSRIAEDIGTVQIPNYIKKHYPGVIIEHSFGREFRDDKDLSSYKLIIHCGGCMIDPQKLKARLHDLEALQIPITNYGIFLAYMQGKETLRRVLRPWGLDL